MDGNEMLETTNETENVDTLTTEEREGEGTPFKRRAASHQRDRPFQWDAEK